jgi:hypothetical protein
MVRAKFYVRAKEAFASPCGSGTVKLIPVCDGSEENKKFFQSTPSGEITLCILNPKAFDGFELGKLYYVDFTQASE